MNGKTLTVWLYTVLFLHTHFLSAQSNNFLSVKADVDFSRTIREWDGFGVNYVETAQTFDYEKNPQDYGGFKYLSDKSKSEIINLVFGDEGLKPSIVKMFLDPLHQIVKDGEYDHKTTSQSMRFFVKRGLEITRERGDELTIITTLYGPPPFITKQKVYRGRDLDPEMKPALLNYYVEWAKFLKDEEKFPLKYISLHNEGESWLRWPDDGSTGAAIDDGHDYNLYWNPEQVVDILKDLRVELDKAGLYDVGLTNGEPTNWYRFSYWGFADAIAEDKGALDALACVTSHGFYVGNMQAGRWYGPHSSTGTDLLRQKKPGLKAWSTSSSWHVADLVCQSDGSRKRVNEMNALFIKEIHSNIYEAKVNALIPWAFIQTASNWNKPDPNPGSAFRVYDDGTWEIKKGYYYFKQVSRAGLPGMAVAKTTFMDSEIALIAFSSNGTKNPNSFVLINIGANEKNVDVYIKGETSGRYIAYRTSGDEVYEYYETAKTDFLQGDNYKLLGNFASEDGIINIITPSNSVTTFFEVEK